MPFQRHLAVVGLLALGQSQCQPPPARATAESPRVHRPRTSDVSAPPSPPPPAPISVAAIGAGRTPVAEGLLLGTEHPILLRAADPQRAWVVVCQARLDTNGDARITALIDEQGRFSGDRLETFFIDQPGPGQPITEFVSSSRGGRYLALIVDEQLWIRDTDAQLADLDLSALGADTRADLHSFLPHRAVAFSPDEQYLLYYRNRPRDQVVVIRHLQTGTEQVIHPGSGSLWRAYFEPSGQFIVLEVVESDTNKNGKLDWPTPPTTSPEPACVGAIPRYLVPSSPGDATTSRLVHLGDDNVISAPGYIAAGDRRWLRRTEQGALEYVDLDGTVSAVASPACQARVLHVDSASEQVVAACTLGKVQRSEVFLLADGRARSLQIKVGAFEVDQFDEAQPRLLPLYPGQETVLFDLRTQAVHHLRDGDLVIATWSEHTLVRRKGSLLWRELDGREVPITTQLQWLRPTLQTDSIVAVAPVVVDLSRQTVVGWLETWPLRVAADGAILHSAQPGSSTRLPEGPLYWQRPAPAP